MKKQVRKGVYETNSSSTHSITMCMKSEYDRWEKDGLFLYKGYGYGFQENNQPEEGNFYTKKEVIEFLKTNKYRDKNFDWSDDERLMEWIHEEAFCDYDYFWDCYTCEFETYEDSIKTPNGDEVVAFGYYG